MDLTRLYNLTTPELREEAERLGVRDTYAMSRGQLIQAIRSQAGDAQPEGLLGKVLGFARWAIQTTAAVAPRPESDDAGRARRPSEVPVPLVGSNKAAAGSATAAEPAAATVAGLATAAAASAKPAAATATAPPTLGETTLGETTLGETTLGETTLGETTLGEATLGQTTLGETTLGEHATARTTTPSARPAPLMTFGGEQPEEEGGTLSGSSSRPPAGVFSRGASSFEEPFPTRTMARILADQGHFKRALAIYAKLLGERPDDRELSSEAEEVQARARARRSELQ